MFFTFFLQFKKTVKPSTMIGSEGTDCSRIGKYIISAFCPARREFFSVPALLNSFDGCSSYLPVQLPRLQSFTN